MSLELENFKEVGGPGNSPDGGQLYSVFSETDALETMKLDDYLNDLSGTLNARDLVILSGFDKAEMIQILAVSSAGVVSINSTTNPVQQLTGPGAIDLTSPITEIITTGTDAYTLANGVAGQRKTIVMITDGGNGTLTPTALLGASTILFADQGDTVTLQVASNFQWAVVAIGGLGGGPVVA